MWQVSTKSRGEEKEKYFKMLCHTRNGVRSLESRIW